MKEIWKDIKGYVGLYQVSDWSRVKSMERKVRHSSGGTRIVRGMILKQQKDHDGYLQASLYREGKESKKSIHRLVAEAFIPNPENKPRVNHIDTNRWNNYALNLEWATHQEDVDHSVSKPVIQFNKQGVEIARFKSANEASRRTGIFQGSISNVCRGLGKTAGDSKWKYACTERKVQ